MTTTHKVKKEREGLKEAESAVVSVLGAMSGEDIESKDVKQLSRDLHKDKDAQKAVSAIAETYSGNEIKVKYCPETGKRYNYTIEICPIHKVELKNVDE